MKLFLNIIFLKKKWQKRDKTKNYSNYGIAAEVAVFHCQQILFASIQTHRN